MASWCEDCLATNACYIDGDDDDDNFDDDNDDDDAENCSVVTSEFFWANPKVSLLHGNKSFSAILSRSNNHCLGFYEVESKIDEVSYSYEAAVSEQKGW